MKRQRAMESAMYVFSLEVQSGKSPQDGMTKSKSRKTGFFIIKHIM